MRHGPPDHKGRAATAGLRRRLARRAQSAIDTARSEGRYRDAERIAADWHDGRAAAALPTAESVRDRAAELARVSLSERIGRVHSH